MSVGRQLSLDLEGLWILQCRSLDKLVNVQLDAKLQEKGLMLLLLDCDNLNKNNEETTIMPNYR